MDLEFERIVYNDMMMYKLINIDGTLPPIKSSEYQNSLPNITPVRYVNELYYTLMYENEHGHADSILIKVGNRYTDIELDYIKTNLPIALAMLNEYNAKIEKMIEEHHGTFTLEC